MTGVVQVALNHYTFSNYVDEARWASYFVQIQEVTKGGPHVLCIGPGDSVVVDVLRRRGFHVCTLDYDSELQPDIVGNIQDLVAAVGGRKFDTILCCQVLEHLPFEALPSILSQFRELGVKRAVISLPAAHVKLFEFSFRFRGRGAAVTFAVPRFWVKWRFDGQHYWEVGVKGFSRRRVRAAISRLGSVVDEYYVRNNRYHLFFVVDVDADSRGC